MRYNKCRVLNCNVVVVIRRNFEDVVLEIVIRENIVIVEVLGYGEIIFEYDLFSNGAVDFVVLGNEILLKFNKV